MSLPPDDIISPGEPDTPSTQEKDILVSACYKSSLFKYESVSQDFAVLDCISEHAPDKLFHCTYFRQIRLDCLFINHPVINCIQKQQIIL